MIEPFKRIVRRHWPPLRLRTILLSTFVLVAALPGFGALFLRVYENSLVRQTEAELVAQGAALSAAAAADLPGGAIPSASRDYVSEPSAIDLRLTHVLPERPPPRPDTAPLAEPAKAWSERLAPILRMTTRTTLASILLLDDHGRILIGPAAGQSYADLPEIRSALAGQPATLLRHNDSYRADYPLEWLSRASDLRIHHARPILVNGQVVGVLLLSRSPTALFVGINEDRGKIAFGVILIFATLVVLSGLLSRGIVRPVEALGEATRAVSEGRGSVPEAPTTAAIEIQALYRDFAVMAAAIERRSLYLRDFAHAMSHEFKTPLAGIGGAVELLQDHPDMAALDRERFLANMAADAERLSHLVSRLLDLARADMAEAVDHAAVDPAALLHRLADGHRSEAFTVTLDLPDALPSVAVPDAMLEAVVITLLENSRQAGATSVTITTRPIGTDLALTIEDNGPGIPPGDRDRVFEPFFTSRRTSGGTGLGLPIARSLLHAQGGEIDLLSGDGGATFRIRLPLGIRR